MLRRKSSQERLSSGGLYASYEHGQIFVFVDVLRHALARLLLEVALHVEVVDGAPYVLKDGLVAHQQVSVLETI